MKKTFALFLSILFLSSFLFADEKLSDKALQKTEKSQITKKDYQSVDKLMSTYKEYAWDGYSWRMRENTYDINDKKLSKNKLLSTKWIITLQNTWDFYLLFYKDDVFKFGGRSAGVLINGTYEIKNDKVILYLADTENLNRLNDILADDLKWMATNQLTGILNYSSDHFRYANELLINEHKFYPDGVYKKAGEKIIINGKPAVSENKIIVLSKTADFYENPDFNSRKIQNYLYSEAYDILPEAVLSGTAAYLLGTVDNWHYILFKGNEGESYYGWIYGNDFEDYDAEKDSYYRELIKEEALKIKENK
jgi:hypothetical protein